jgi:sulfate/thiosulfate transport system substrate-binding protein
MIRSRTRQFRAATVVAALLAMLAISACGGSSSDSGGGGDGSGGSLTLVAYSTPEEAFREIIPAFNKTPEGEGVSFDQS